ncbi:hypothetical protein [Eisenbergiella tayi]|uniref:hypothetical protein n=1 Tax=Eisenbergiella tayi TaxID=1432052 RepID=UPI0008486CFD|nr:hypothetical protein [Eisenbergiella tayi]ODR29525.1 hypothetical protein BEI60_30240 [Eisenbergiella tayi]
MCKVAINRLFLGARELGWELWNGKEIIEMTSGQIKTALKGGRSEILGLVLDEKGELQLDKKGYMMQNIMCKVHIGKLTPMIEDELVMMNIFYYVVGIEEQDGEILYQAVSSRFARETLKAEKLLALYELGAVAGGMKVENGKIITYFDRKEQEVTEKKAQAVKEENASKVREPGKKVQEVKAEKQAK